MRRIFAELCVSVLVAAAVMLVASAAVGDAHKVTVLHKGKLISVAAKAVPALVAHGACLVRQEVCDGVDNDCAGSIDEAGVYVTAVLCHCLTNTTDYTIDECVPGLSCADLAQFCTDRCPPGTIADLDRALCFPDFPGCDPS